MSSRDDNHDEGLWQDLPRLLATARDRGDAKAGFEGTLTIGVAGI